MTESGTLFDQTADWQEQPLVAYAAFLCSAKFVALGWRRSTSPGGEHQPGIPLSARSAQVCLAMFATFNRWLEQRGKTLFTLTSEDLRHFLEEGNTINSMTVRRRNSGICLRYLRLLERILIHVGVTPNTARHACFDLYHQRQSKATAEDAPKVALTVADQEAFMRALPDLPDDTQANGGSASAVAPCKQ